MIIEQHSNILTDKKLQRLLEHDINSKQINIFDTRFYSRFNKFYPSITYILSSFPKGQYFLDFIKQTGYNSEIIARNAANEGTMAHQLIERYINGEELKWIEDNGKVNYPIIVWRMVLRFADFWNTVKPKLIASEQHIFSDVYQFAGTLDMVVEIEDKLWVLDIKTSNNLNSSYDLQLAAYKQAWDENFDRKIDKTAIIWLKSQSRKLDKTGKKIKGNGWELKESENIEHHFNTFMKLYDIFKIDNEMKPISEKIPNTLKLQ